MSKRKQSDTARLIAWAMTVTEPELVTMAETITALREARFPAVVKAKPRAVRADKGSKRPQQSRLNPPAVEIDATI